MKYMYGMNNSGKLFDDELTEWFIETGFFQYQSQMSIYYKYAPYVTKIVVLYYVDYCFYWYMFEALGKLSVETLRNILIVKFLGYVHWFMSIRISHMMYHSISVDQARCSTSIVTKYMDTATVKTSTNFYKTNFPSGMIFTKDVVSTSDEQVERITRGLNIQYRACIG